MRQQFTLTTRKFLPQEELKEGNGINTFNGNIGYSFSGFGGYCGPYEPPSHDNSLNFNTYGDFDDRWDLNDTWRTYGTGNPNDTDFAGGGKIVILAENRLQILNSNVTAIGTSNCASNLTDRLHAGTGGYIYVAMSDNNTENLNINTSFYDVSGGKACSNT